MLRPKTLDEIIGQDSVVHQLRIAVESSIKRSCAMPHMLFDGPPGLGKTTLATAVAATRESNIQIANGGNIRTIKNILPYIAKLNHTDILFIDEIHRIPVAIEEFLYPIMEDFRVDIGEENKKLSMNVEPFTLIGATTEAGSLSRPFFDRFTYKYTLELYNEDTLSEIVKRSVKECNLDIDDSAAVNIAKRSRGTPRIANGFVVWLRDVCLARGSRSVSDALVDESLGLIGVDAEGVTERDRAYLTTLKNRRGPMGLRSISDATNIDEDTIRNIIEPFLIRKGLIERTPKGMVLI